MLELLSRKQEKHESALSTFDNNKNAHLIDKDFFKEFRGQKYVMPKGEGGGVSAL